MGSIDDIPYWQVNCPPHERSAECPPHLIGLSEKDQRIIKTPDDVYKIVAWEEVRAIVRENRLELFQRAPSQLRRYKAFTYNLAKKYGSVSSFILKQRLCWEGPIEAQGGPFEYADDYKILWNDWPYGLDPRVAHLVVWTKFELRADEATGDLTKTARKEIDNFVTKTFCSRVPKEHVVWFKNWASLKSVHAVEHFHVMMFDPDPGFIREITNGDTPQCNKADL